jgi:DNA ligase-1
MKYKEFVDVYELLAGTTKKLEKVDILAGFLRELSKKGKSEWIYMLRGRVLPDYDPREFGISRQLVIKAISRTFGISNEKVVEKFRKIGDLGEVSEEFAGKRNQTTLFGEKLSAEKVFDNLRRLVDIEGKGAVDKKLNLVGELLSSASGKEAKYIVRTLLNDLRVGVADALLRDAIAEAFLSKDGKEHIEFEDEIERVYDLANDFAIVFDAAIKGKNALKKIDILPGVPLKVMLPVKVTKIEEGFEVCGKPAAFEHKYDGFRMLIHKHDENIWLFTRKLENVTKQFPDVVSAIKEHVKGKSFILDSEIVGYDIKTKKDKPFEAISQRIKRKYDVDKLIKQLPVQINVFDILFLNGESLMDKMFKERRKILEKVIEGKKMVIRCSFQIITSDEKEAEKFYEKALEIGEEGVMIKKLDAPYRQGRRVGYIAKIKPEVNDLDLVIMGAEYGTGKRGGWLTSYIVGCRRGNEFVEVGRVSSGLKELEQEGGTTYKEMTKLLEPLVIKKEGRIVHVKPKIVVSVLYQNIQKSPSYNSGYALRFPRITHYRPDRNTGDIADIKDIEKESHRAGGFRGGVG